LDFQHLNMDQSLSAREREKLRRKKVKDAKQAIEERLKRLQKAASGEGLEGDDLRYWKLFENINEPNKFAEAARRGRLRFQLGQRDRFIEGIYQSGRHLKEMEEIFRREGVPIELTRLPFVESSFNMKARSKVGASGIWQFMRSTARMYMRMDSSVDERNDPLRATVAAARKMRNNFQMLETWPLAVTGYNHGPSGVQRLVRKFKTNDIAELTDVRKGRFGFASANFYASFLAALQVEQEAETHFGPVKWMAELRGHEIKLTRFLRTEEILKWFDGDLTKAQTYNPHVRPHVWRRGALQPRTFVRVPAELLAKAESDLKSSKFVPPVSVAENETEYIIQEGETLSEIADRFKVKVRALMEMNGIDDARRVRAQQKILIPSRVGANSPPPPQTPAAVGP
jgi:membrane-bound lytic murein transglycosylase D